MQEKLRIFNEKNQHTLQLVFDMEIHVSDEKWSCNLIWFENDKKMAKIKIEKLQSQEKSFL